MFDVIMVIFVLINIYHLVMIMFTYGIDTHDTIFRSYFDLINGNVPLLERANWLGYIILVVLFVLLLPSILLTVLGIVIWKLYKKIYHYAFNEKNEKQYILPCNQELLAYCREKRLKFTIDKSYIHFHSKLDYMRASNEYDKITRSF